MGPLCIQFRLSVISESVLNKYRYRSETLPWVQTTEQCCGSVMIYSGSGSRFEFSELRIQAKVPDPCGSGSSPCYLSIFKNCKQNHLKCNPKEESMNYLPFSISNYSPKVHKVQNSEKLHFYLSALSYLAGSGSGTIIQDPDPGKSS